MQQKAAEAGKEMRERSMQLHRSHPHGSGELGEGEGEGGGLGGRPAADDNIDDGGSSGEDKDRDKGGGKVKEDAKRKRGRQWSARKESKHSRLAEAIKGFQG
jgi:hypothetical protein